ncbi:MAG: alpha-isopropylmalate synthase regulatory domain-containing protein [Clostridia bacterium]|nr:alpha-isopropylmalate synthase regulatory domain-containing protein [Clostridia bacterium]
MKKINITDITLKKLSEEREISLLFREKSAIANCADSLGADAVELPPVKNLREDNIIYKTIAQNVQNAVLAIPVGFNTEDVESVWECIKDAKKPRLQIELPVSTIQMEYTYHIKQDKMLAKISELIKTAKKYCDDVEFAALDATRADSDFIIAAAKEAEVCGAGIITLCDSAGTSIPEEIAELVAAVKGTVNIPVYVQVSDRISMAVASAFAAISAGADGLKCAMAGKDALQAGEISDAISVCGAQIDAEIMLNNTKIHSSIDDMLSSINHEAYDAENTVSEKKKILLDSDSTLAQVAQAAAVLGYELSDSDCGNVHKALMQVCEKKGAVGSKEFEAVIASSAMQAPSTYHFESYTTTSSNVASSMSQVTLRCNDEIMCGVSAGDGPIDSAFRAIEQCIGYHYELDDFQVQSVTEGKEALGSALVRLRNNGKLYSGNGTSTDIIAASIRAYINAMNKIVFEEE